MSLISQPLDYSSGATRAAVQGIRDQIQMSSMRAEEQRREAKQSAARVGAFEKAMSSAEGSVKFMSEKAQQVFSAYHDGYEIALEEYSENPTQENLNSINRIIGEANEYISRHEGLYNADRSTLLTGLGNSEKFTTTPESMSMQFNDRYKGYETAPRWDAELGTVVVSGTGAGSTMRASQDPMFNPNNALVFESTSKIPSVVAPEQYGNSNAALYYGRSKEDFMNTLTARFNANNSNGQSLNYSAAALMSLRDYGQEDIGLGIQDILGDPAKMAEARQMYMDQAWSQASSINSRRRDEENAGVSYDGSDTVTFVKEDYDYDSKTKTTTELKAKIPTFEKPIKVLIEADPGQEATPTYQRVVLGAARLEGETGIVVKENVATAYYQDPSTGEISNTPVMGWDEKTRYQNVSRVIRPIGTEGRKEYAAYVNALKKQNALNQGAKIELVDEEKSSLPGPPMPPQ
jgi:hypothetical protein|tara:strand:- start:2307 stop:3689 length:1383 start_codon:yes stop_codon:yes gene_type:complete